MRIGFAGYGWAEAVPAIIAAAVSIIRTQDDPVLMADMETAI